MQLTSRIRAIAAGIVDFETGTSTYSLYEALSSEDP